jgi:hypothetical protein
MLRLEVRVQSLDTGLFLTRGGEWVKPAQTKQEVLSMPTVQAIKLCLRLGIKNAKFTARSATGKLLTEYPFLPVKVLVRQISTGLYWNRENGWGQSRKADVFQDARAALRYCIQKGMRDIHLVLRFDDPRYDMVRWPFGEEGNELTSQELVGQTQALRQRSKGLRGQAKVLLAGVEQTVAQLKEQRKRLPFKR